MAKPTCGGNHQGSKSNNSTFTPHPPCKIEILKQVVITKAAEPVEHLAPDEDRLITKKPAEHSGAQFREEAGRTEKS